MTDDSTTRRSHPVTERYVTSDIPLLEILQTTAAPASATAKACLAIEESLEGKKLARDAIRLAQAVAIQDADPELLILMLSSWADLSCRIGRPSEAEVLIHRSKALVADTTHPEITARMMYVESLLADTTGNKERCEKILREILDTIPEFSPRRKFYVWDLALLQALQGRGSEAEDELKKVVWQCNKRFELGRVHLVQFVTAVETGQMTAARQLSSHIEATIVPKRDSTRIPVQGYQSLLDLMEGQRNSPSVGPPPTHEYALVTHSLLHGDIETALKLARIEADRMGTLFGSGFSAFDLVRAELAGGNGVAAARLIRMRRSRGNLHYLDDFFLARVEWRAGNRRTAARHFAEALASIEQYQARGRLDFEMKLACEMTHTDIVELTRKAESAKPKPRLKLPLRFTVKAAAEADPPPAVVILGRSEAIEEVRRAIKQFADLDAPVLITGETGVGKELVARSLHQTRKLRDEPFTPVNCGSITETLLESELFGHEKGAFTGAERAAEGLFAATGQGTIFLDEIGDISQRLQGALLRVLEMGEIRSVGSTQTRKIACRVVAATNVNLESLAQRGTFRQDLIFRLQRLEIHIPPLRERRDDILLLARHFLDTGRPIGIHADLSPDLRDTIRSYDWPGNVRELRNVIERMRLLHSDKLSYGVDDLDLKFQSSGQLTPLSSSVSSATMPTDNPPAPPSPATSPVSGSWPTPRAPLPPQAEDVTAFLKQGRSPMRRLERLRELFVEHRRLARSEIIQILQVSPNTATKDLKTLISEGSIRRVEPSASSRSYYFEVTTTE